MCGITWVCWLKNNKNKIKSAKRRELTTGGDDLKNYGNEKMYMLQKETLS